MMQSKITAKAVVIAFFKTLGKFIFWAAFAVFAVVRAICLLAFKKK